MSSFLAMARQKPDRREVTDLNAIADAAPEIAAYDLRSSGITVVRKLGRSLPFISGDPDQLHQVAVNLLVNAQQALADVVGAGKGRVSRSRR